MNPSYRSRPDFTSYRSEIIREPFYKSALGIGLMLIIIILILVVFASLLFFILQEKIKLDALYRLTQQELDKCQHGHFRNAQYANTAPVIQPAMQSAMQSYMDPNYQNISGTSVTYRDRTMM